MPACCACGVQVEKYANGSRCRDCYNSYMREYSKGRYERRRDAARVMLGGKCVDCGSTDQLQFDHIDPASKKIDVLSRNWSSARFWDELKKCVLRCKPCHIAKSAREQSVEHGGGLSGKKNCKCEKCKATKRRYMGNYMKRKKLS